jgi:hypothetical protein
VVHDGPVEAVTDLAAGVEAARVRHALDDPVVRVPEHSAASPARQWISQLHADRATLLQAYDAAVAERTELWAMLRNLFAMLEGLGTVLAGARDALASLSARTTRR